MNVTERFLKYVAFDTQSDEHSESCPSSEKQKLLGAALVEEMKAIGVADARMDEWGYVYGSVPGTAEGPVIGLIAHMDTAPDCSGTNVRRDSFRDLNSFLNALLNKRAKKTSTRSRPDLYLTVSPSTSTIHSTNVTPSPISIISSVMVRFTPSV